MDWAGARAAARDGVAAGTAAHLIAVETTPGLFGARADGRLALPPAAIEAVVERVAAHWLPGIAAADNAGCGRFATQIAFEARTIAALQAAGLDAPLVHRGRRRKARAAHAVVLALNQRLGAVGRTVRYIAAPDGDALPGLAPLREAIDSGEVEALLVLGGNPAYDAPGALRMSEALARVEAAVVHLGPVRRTRPPCWPTGTCRCRHVYEQWSDARAFDGSASLIQPVIAPLYDTRSVHELLASMLDDATRSGRELLRRQWRREGQDDASFDAFWRESLRNGVVESSAFAAEALVNARAFRRHSAKARLATAELTAVFVSDATTADGSYANNGWLQELPRPFTQITWGNALHLGPATAASLGLASGDVVRATVGGRSIEAPVWVLAAACRRRQATLPLGCGRRNAGRVGNGVGFDACSLRPTTALSAPATLRKTGRTHAFAVTQHPVDPARPRTGCAPCRPARAVAARRRRCRRSIHRSKASPPHAWAMTIDLDACTGCNACTVACQAENNIPVVGAEQVALGRVMHWIRVDRHDLPEIGNTACSSPCLACIARTRLARSSARSGPPCTTARA